MAIPTTLPTMSIYRGDSLTKKFLLGPLDENGVVQPGTDLTAYGTQWKAQLRSSENDDTDYDFTVDTSEASNGYITITMTAEVTATLPSKGVGDLQVTDTGANPPVVRTWARWNFTLVKDVTR